MGKGRRNFLKTSVGAVVGMVAWPAVNKITIAQEPIAPQQQQKTATATRTVAKYGLALRDQSEGWIKKIEGGHPSGDVLTEKIGPDRLTRPKVIVKYEAITITCGGGLGKAFYEWLANTIAGQQSEGEDGAILYADREGSVISHLSFFGAFIDQIDFPGVDATSKDEGILKVKFEIEHSAARSGGLFRFTPEERKPWLASNFRLTIDGIEGLRPKSIQPVTWKQMLVGSWPRLKALDKTVSDLVISVPEAQAQVLLKWRQTSSKKDGTLEYLSPDLKTTLFQLGFKGLAIKTMTPNVMGTTREMRVAMSVDALNFTVL
ncbi:MAG TPA: hypothetical protein VGJ66_02755 [Pyrinomonadaceae bacterium]|jgi:hypothetical protein